MSPSLEQQTTSTRHSDAIQHLIHEGTPEAAEEAVQMLQRETKLHPDDPRRWADLAAVRMASAELADEPLFLVEALVDAERAVSLDPTSPVARFNRALASHRLGLGDDAARAWREYLALGGDDGWSREARRRLAQMHRRNDPATVWEGVRQRLTAGPGEPSGDAWDADEVAAVLTPYRGTARTWLQEEVLPAWAIAYEAGRGEAARAHLDTARLVAGALARAGNPLPAEAVAVIDQADHGNGRETTKLRHLARGHRAYGEAVALGREGRLADAKARAGVARDHLIAAGSPFRHWVELQQALLHFQDHEVPRTFQILDQLKPSSRPYPALEGHRSWLRAHALSTSSRRLEARESYRQAVASFTRAGEAESLADVHVRLAEIHDLLGDPARAWRHRRRALRRLPVLPGLRSRVYVVASTARALRQAGLAEAALHEHGEAIDMVRRQGGDAHLMAVLLFQQADASLALDDAERAREGLEDAYQQATRVPDPMGLYLRARIRAVEGRLLARTGATRNADRAYAEALAQLPADEQHGFRARLHLERATLQRAAGRTEAAAAELAAGLEEVDREWQEILDGRRRGRDEEVWPRLLSDPRETFDLLIGLLIDQERQTEAFEVAERSRARDVLHLLAGLTDGADRRRDAWRRPLSLAEVRRALPPGLLLIQYHQLPDRLVVWTVRREGARARVVNHSRRWTTRAVAALGQAAANGQRELASRVREELSTALLEPVAGEMRSGDLLVFVPDGAIHGIPFAALPLPRSAATATVATGTGTLVVERHAVAVAPSSTMFEQVLERDRRLAAGRRVAGPVRALFVGDPAFEPRHHPGFERLPRARSEARRSAAGYAGATVLVEDQVTRQRLLEQLPRHHLVHYAGHAVLNQAQPYKSYLLLAPAGTTEEGALYADELLRRPLPATRMVILSACSSARGGSLAELGVAPLVRPFLGGGVPAVVGSLWDVDDRSAEMLLVEFHRHLRAGTPGAEALRQAQLALLHGEDPALAGPWSWASFQLVGHMDGFVQPALESEER